MARPRPSIIAGGLLAVALLAGCGTTVTLKQPATPAAPAGAPDSSAAAASPATPGGPASVPAPEAAASGGSVAVPPEGPAAPAGRATPPGVAQPVAAGIPVASVARSSTPTVGDRFSSALQTGTVGAAFGGLGGPIGMAAGGGAGFLAGFLAGRPVFGGGGVTPGPGGSWEDQVEEQQAWEDQVAARVEQLDGSVQPAATGIGSNPSPQAAYPAAAGAPRAMGALPDPLEDYEAWAQQITKHAASPAARARAAEVAAVAPAETTAASAAGSPSDAEIVSLLRGGGGAPGDDWQLRAFDADQDGRAEAWFGYEGEVLQRHALDRNGDGRPDRLDVYEGDDVAERHLDEDGDGRFERRDTLVHGRVTASMIDQNGDGRFETLTLPPGEGRAAAAEDTP